MKQASRYLALLLRHKPEAGGLTLDGAGWADVEAVLAALGTRFGAFSRDDLEALVRDNDKKRYAFNEDGKRIRASQGHSVAVELGLDPAPPPPRLWHGTKRAFLGSILADGLQPGKRRHVHLSADLATATSVGNRRAGETVILTVRSGDMAAAGHLFYLSANGVWLCERVPPSFIESRKA